MATLPNLYYAIIIYKIVANSQYFIKNFKKTFYKLKSIVYNIIIHSKGQFVLCRVRGFGTKRERGGVGL